jgi:hypothetical protein
MLHMRVEFCKADASALLASFSGRNTGKLGNRGG